jgi:3-hydroxymyristoyl/3-hydroxydecanoyl-(acyl carrier protein) dehydratase
MSEPAGAAAPIGLVFAPEHPVFAGHFPQQPIVPGALLLDAALQAIEAGQPSGAGAARYHVAAVKFFRPVGPGEALSLSLTRAPDGRFQFEWRSGANCVASGAAYRIFAEDSGRS